MGACSALAFAAPVLEPPSAKGFAAIMIGIGGTADMAAGLFGVQVERSRTDIALGIISIAAAIVLAFIPASDAFLLTALLTLWLMARGLTELVGAALSVDKSEAAAAARLARGGIDLLLGLVALIGSLTTIWGQAIFGWPETIVRTILLFAAISLLAAGLLHAGVALLHRRGG
jgi:uncharacterized membrane protein HdeD (DUF308 family)